MPTDQSKQPVDTPTWPPTVTLTFTPWIFAQYWELNGVQGTCETVSPPYQFMSPVVLSQQPTYVNGRPYYYAENGTLGTVQPFSSIQLAWNIVTGGTYVWNIAFFNEYNPAPPNYHIDASQWAGPDTISPNGAYTAYDFATGTPPSCTNPTTVTISA